MKTVRAYLSTLLIAALVFASLPVVAAPTAPQGDVLLWQLYEKSADRCSRGGTVSHLAGGCKEFWEREPSLAGVPGAVRQPAGCAG